MTATESIIAARLETVHQALQQEEEKVKELRAIERVLVEVLEGEGVKQEATTGRPATLKEIVRGALEGAGRAISVSDVEQAVKSARGTAHVNKQGIYSTLHELAKHKEAKRVRPGMYRAVAHAH